MEGLPTDLWVSAQLRRLNDAGTPAYLVRRGDAERGTLLVKVNLLEKGCAVWTQVRSMEGDLTWMKALKGETVSNTEADEYVARTTARDPDLWVIEIEDRSGVNPFA
jgi:hypothetical protein